MKISLTTKIVIYFGFLTLITIANFGILINTENETSEQHHWVLHTHKVIERSERFLGYMRDAETGQRGFLLTLNESYLEPFNTGIAHANSEFEILKKLTQDNLVQQTRLGHIQTLVSEKFSELEETIQLAKQDKFTEAMTIVNSDNGKIVMDAIREHIREFISEEEHLLKERSEIYLENKNNLRMLFYLEAALLVSLIIISYILIQRIIVQPLTLMINYIANEGDNINGTGIKTKKKYDEIGILIEAFNKLHRDVVERTNEKDILISELQKALDDIKTLQGIIPICSYCHKVRNDEGSWDEMVKYISKHSSALFSHGICPECLAKARADAGLDD